MNLRDKQSLFAVRLAKLILHAQSLGFEVTLGEVWRSAEEAKRLTILGSGIARSLHCDRLAADVNLFRHGEWLTTSSAHQPLGQWWEQQSTPDAVCVWGGSWGHDANHYSITHSGRK